MMRFLAIVILAAWATTILVLCLLLVINAHAEDYDLLAYLHKDFPRRAAIEELPIRSGVGILDWSFGTDLRPIETLLKSGKVFRLRVHLINGPGYNNRVLGKYEPLYGMDLNKALENKNQKLIKHITTRADLWCKAANEVELFLSPVLEFERLSDKAQRNMVEATKRGCPTAKIVLSPRMTNVPVIPGYIKEYHGKTPPPCKACFTSLDGSEAMDIDINAWLKRTRNYAFRAVWSRSFNCRHQGNWEDPRERTACPTRQQLREIIHVTHKRPKAPKERPAQCKTVTPLKEETFKPASENKGTGDRRANKPVSLARSNAKTLLVIAATTGKEVARLGYYGPYQAGLSRHYSCYGSGTCLHGYEMEEKAVKEGSPWVYLRDGGKCLGPLIPGRRQGTYR